MGRLSVNDLAEDHLNAVLLACTELVTNAYDHADGRRQVWLRRNRVPCWELIEVDDGVAEQQSVVGRSRFGGSAGPWPDPGEQALRGLGRPHARGQQDRPGQGLVRGRQPRDLPLSLTCRVTPRDPRPDKPAGEAVYGRFTGPQEPAVLDRAACTEPCSAGAAVTCPYSSVGDVGSRPRPDWW